MMHIKNKIDTNPLNSASSSASLLSILDDKNKKIETLKKQIQNQKLQLMYYLNRSFDQKKIMQLSRNCLPHAQDSSITVNLACTKFYNSNGIRSKIICLYDRLRTIDNQLSCTVQLQEFILRKIIHSICNFAQRQNVLKNCDVELYSFLRNTHQLEVISQLLENTAHLNMKLNTLRICCKQLIIVEDERNAIVEQVYALPVEERLSSNYLAELQMEKMEMERKIRRIEDRMKQQQDLQHDWNEKSDIKSFEIETLENDEDMKINKMLKKVNNEALMVLEKTIEHKKRRQVIEFAFENAVNTEHVLKYIRAIFQQSNSDNSSLDKNRIFAAIKNEIRTQVDILTKLHDTEIKAKLKDIEMLQGRLWELTMEKDEVKDYLKRMEKDLDEIRSDLRNEITKLASEKDMYKTQVDDLQAIRSAYAQLVERQPNIAAIERKYKKQIAERDRRIKELQEERERAKAEQMYQNNVIETQSNEIKCLIKAVEKFKLMVTDNGNNYVNSPVVSCCDEDERDNLVNDSEADENIDFEIMLNNHENNINDFNSYSILEELKKIDDCLGRENFNQNFNYIRNGNEENNDKQVDRQKINNQNNKECYDAKLVESIFKQLGDFKISSDALLDSKNCTTISSTDLTPEESAESCISTLELHSLTNDPKLCLLKQLIDTDSILHGCLNISSNKISIEFNYNPMMLTQNKMKRLDCHQEQEEPNEEEKNHSYLQNSYDVEKCNDNTNETKK